jgi:hypothetical protein
MNNPYNIAILCLRLFGLMGIFLGILSILYFIIFIFSLWFHAPDWFSQSLASYAVANSVSAPLWFVGSIIIIKSSRRLASFVIKACDL